MDLKQQLIHRKYKKCEAENQITIGDDYSVPEGKPDIASILQKKADLMVEEVHTEKGKIRLRGNLKVQILYLAQRSEEMADCLNVQIPFDEILYMENASSGDNLKIDWCVEELKVSLVHPGKISIRAVVSLKGEITASLSHLISEGVEDDAGVQLQREIMTVAEPVLERKDSFRIRDEISLPANKPNVQKVLWKDLQLRNLDVRNEEGHLAMKGEVLLLFIYVGEEGHGVMWFEQTIPVQGTLEMTGLTEEMFGLWEKEVTHQEIEVKPDYDGELRSISLEMVLEIHGCAFEERTFQALTDVYSTKEQLKLQREPVTYERLRMCSEAKLRLNTKEQLEDEETVLQILGHHAQLKNKRASMQEQGILCEGVLEVQVLYVTAEDEKPFGTAVLSVPYSQMIEIPGILPTDSWRVCENIDQLSISMSDSHSVEIRSVLMFGACVMQQCSIDNIVGITGEAYAPEEYQKMPGVKIHFVQNGETLWNIAKTNRTTMEEIRQLNDLNAEEVTAGQKLLLVKNMMESMI